MVFATSCDGHAAVAKCALAGMSRSTLVATLGARVRDDDVERRAETWAQALACSPEGTSLEILAEIVADDVVRVPRVLVADRDVTVVERVPADGATRLTGQQAEHLWRAMERLWKTSAVTGEGRRHGVNANHRRSIEWTYERKFGGTRAHRYLRTALPAPRLHRAVGAVVDGVALSRPRAAATPRLVHGDLKPEHVISSVGGHVHLIDPAVHLGDPRADVARLLLRSALASGGAGAALQGRAGEAATELGGETVVVLMAMDWVNIVTTWATSGLLRDSTLLAQAGVLMSALGRRGDAAGVASDLAAAGIDAR